MTNSAVPQRRRARPDHPGPGGATVAAVGYAAAGIAGGLLAALVAFSPSFSFILLGGQPLRTAAREPRRQAFLDGAGPAAIGAILGAAIALAMALTQTWQLVVLAAAAIALLVLRRGVVHTLLGAGAPWSHRSARRRAAPLTPPHQSDSA